MEAGKQPHVGLIPFKRKDSRRRSTTSIWPYVEMIKNTWIFKKREKEKIELVSPNRADSSIVADVFPSLIIKLQRPQQTIAKLSQMAAHTWGRSNQLGTALMWIESIFWLSLQEAGQTWLHKGYRHIEGSRNLTMNTWVRLFEHQSCNQHVQVASRLQLCLVYISSLEPGAVWEQCEIS